MIYNDLLWSTMTYYDLHRPTMTTFLRSDKAEIWYRHKSSYGDQLGHYELSPLCHVTSYQTLFKKSTFLRSDKAEMWHRQKTSEGDQFGHYELSLLCHVTSYQTLFKNPLSWGRTKLKSGTDRNQVTVISLDTMNCHHYVMWLVTRSF